MLLPRYRLLYLILPLYTLSVGCVDAIPEFGELTQTLEFSYNNTLTSEKLIEDTSLTVDLSYDMGKKVKTKASWCEVSDLINLSQDSPCECSSGICKITLSACSDCNDSNSSFSFSYSIGNESLSSESSPVSISVDEVNDAPVSGGDQAESTNEDQLFSISLNPGSDIENGPLSYIISSSPLMGTLSNCMGLDASSLTDTNCNYMPSSDQYGVDSFTYYIDDGADTTSNITVTININPMPDAPVAAVGDTVLTDENIGVNFNITPAFDAEGDTLTYSILTLPSIGLLSNCLGLNASAVSDLNCDYLPSSNLNGLDSLTYSVSDGNGGSNTGTVSITVTSVNSPPVPVTGESFSGTEETPMSFTISPGTDIETASLIYTFSSGATNGTLSNCLGLNSSASDDLTCDYTPVLNFFGTEHLYYTISDGQDSVSVYVALPIANVNDAPTLGAAQSVVVRKNYPN